MSRPRILESQTLRLACPWILLLGHAAAIGQAAPQPPSLQQRQAQSLAATCAACHGTDGRATPGSAIPPLAGLAKDAFTQRMLGFRDGTRPATVMHQISKGYSPQQIDALAVYFSSQGGKP